MFMAVVARCVDRAVARSERQMYFAAHDAGVDGEIGATARKIDRRALAESTVAFWAQRHVDRYRAACNTGFSCLLLSIQSPAAMVGCAEPMA